MASFRDFLSGSKRGAKQTENAPAPAAQAETRAPSEFERRSGDRRTSIDLGRPSYLERRKHRETRREIDAAKVASIPQLGGESGAAKAEAIAALADADLRPLPELETDINELHAAMDRRLKMVKDLSDEEFEAVQAKAETLVTAWATEVKTLEAEIAASRQREAQG